MKPSLLILAAGMGSRYGGLKQLDPVGPHGEYLLDYAVYDAVKAGFGKVVFLIKKNMEEEFKKIVSSRYVENIEIDYAFQGLEHLPPGFTVPESRTKPWGTAHAVMVTEGVINEPFAAINADDYYGPSSYQTLYNALNKMDNDSKELIMVGFRIENTLSEYGHVARGLCTISDDYLVSITEREEVMLLDGMIVYKDENGEHIEITPGTIVSMNFWGFAPDTVYPILKEQFAVFMKNHGYNPKAEFYIPVMIDHAISLGKVKVKVLESDENWFGMTYKEDKVLVKENIRKKINEGIYPESLFVK